MKKNMLMRFVFLAIGLVQAASSPLRSESPSFVPDGTWSKILSSGLMHVYAGKVIAYKTNSGYLDDGDSYAFNEDLVRYGFISPDWDDEEGGYQLSHLLNFDGFPFPVVLSTANLTESSTFFFKIRFISPEEKAEIYEALKDNRAQFAAVSFDDEVLLSALNVPFRKRKLSRPVSLGNTVLEAGECKKNSRRHSTEG